MAVNLEKIKDQPEEGQPEEGQPEEGQPEEDQPEERKIPELTDEQIKACVKLKDFLQAKDYTNFLLLGPAGSGKTTVIVNAFVISEISRLKVAFCAFTNKATQVLKNISRKIDLYTDGKTKLNADFLTIHKLLSLEIKFKEAEDEIGFTFDEKKMTYLNSSDIDVIVFDECSIISKELFSYIKRAWDYTLFLKQKKLKFIFLGDFWQLPPIAEETSIVFDSAKNGWIVSKLHKVMRAANLEMKHLNDSFLRTIEVLGQKKYNEFWKTFPYGIIPKHMFRSNAELIDSYFELSCIKPTGTEPTKSYTGTKKSTMVLTFSNVNCLKINHAIQDFIDREQKREPIKERKSPIFFPGDKCCVERPIEVRQIKRDETKLKISGHIEQIRFEEPTLCRFGMTTNQTIYNGEILEILATEDINIVTTINTIRGTPKFFPAQLLYVRRIDDDSLHEIVNIDKDLINKCRSIIRHTMKKDGYLMFMSEFYSYVPLLNYGYCITIYKAQGSEWDNVICNISSIEASIVREGAELNTTILTRLFKTTYTALTRARERVICLYLTGN